MTPYQGGESAANLLNGSLLTVEGERHTVFQTGVSDCVNDIVADYLIDLEVPEEDANCSL